MQFLFIKNVAVEFNGNSTGCHGRHVNPVAVGSELMKCAEP